MISTFPRSGVLILGPNSVQSLLPSTLISQAESLLENHYIDEAVNLANQQRKKLQGKMPVDVDEVSICIKPLRTSIESRLVVLNRRLMNCAMSTNESGFNILSRLVSRTLANIYSMASWTPESWSAIILTFVAPYSVKKTPWKYLLALQSTCPLKLLLTTSVSAIRTTLRILPMSFPSPIYGTSATPTSSSIFTTLVFFPCIVPVGTDISCGQLSQELLASPGSKYSHSSTNCRITPNTWNCSK